jgi:selenocysteine lyase/cysteine desulfurase
LTAGGLIWSAVGEAARAVGAPLVLDLTQSLGVMAFDATAVQPDFAVAAGYKWLSGPYTLGYLYVAPQHQSGEPLEENWINRERSEDFSQLINYRDGYQPGARRFDMGERSNHQLSRRAGGAACPLGGSALRPPPRISPASTTP